jgi:hypothetical protein
MRYTKASSQVTDLSSLPVLPPEGMRQAPASPQVGGLAELLPWLLLQLGQEGGGETPSGGSLPRDKNSKELARFDKKQAVKEALSQVPGTTEPPRFTKAPRREPGSPSPTPAQFARKVAPSVDLPTSQQASAVPNPPVTPAGVAPVSRSADVRDNSQAVDRSVDNAARRYVKRTGLVNPEQRLYQKSLEPGLKLFRKRMA